ncbi:MAG: Gfo/Idh/MocA family oxidoreductase [Candidatus Endonucleobacter bathymodioli]|uniref:Gfo/Idh/MocA family oxidoreductase n=1 Tax=Candidatus Endonucleibacter bathymodioli TaxID=539814 RepID=A0AA90NUK7_9GAMM|nr:Gfo/Idh/MocA family oxidoreductase [Candidatus Endonucleobacter bathymodioli]
MKNFALIGASGYIAPQHMRAIKDTGNDLVAAFDINDSVGVMDNYFSQASFFVEFERFDRYIDKLKGKQNKIDYISITSPNHLHDSHVRFALRQDADAICEKPLVLNPHNLDMLKIIESETRGKVFNILQLRLHPSIIALKERVECELTNNPDKIFDVELTYLTSRGKWYFISWKGDNDKSGGIATNIGIHFFDMLSWIFGDVKESEVHIKKEDVNAGFMQLKHARVSWFLSVNADYIPEPVKASGQRTYRSITVNGHDLEFSTGFTDLHTKSYKQVLQGNGFGLEEARKSIEIVSDIRNKTAVINNDNLHPFTYNVIKNA